MTAEKRRLLITGAAGWVGRQLRQALHGDYDLRLLDVRPMEGDDVAAGHSEVVVGSMTDPNIMRRACEGVDTVLHLGIGARPGGMYGLSKVFGEMLGQQYAESGALSAVAIRLFSPNSYATARQRAREVVGYCPKDDAEDLLDDEGHVLYVFGQFDVDAP